MPPIDNCAGWAAAYDFDFSESSSPQRLPTRAA